MSFSKTIPQFKARTKTVTRRDGWLNLKPGDVVTAIEKGMGLKKGERQVVLGDIEVVTTWRERLGDITPEDVAREGFPGETPEFFIRKYGKPADHIVTRIAYRYLDEDQSALPAESEADTVSTKASDRYCTPDWWLALLYEFWPGGVDCDAFADSESSVVARHYIDARKGGNAYVDDWPGRRVFAQGPYSGRFPALTAARCALMHDRGKEIVSLCPAAVGSNYWRSHVWPTATAIAWMGRMAFPAGVDVHAKDGRLVCAAGKAQGGNRTEIAAVYQGPDWERYRRVFSAAAAVTVQPRWGATG
ncbi:MAG: DNA N-6-adenine-methyltransferase [Myxococcota bacterium]